MERQSPRPTLQNSLQRLSSPGSPRHRPTAMVSSRSQDGYARSASPESHGTSHSPSRRASPAVITPLLMPPPSTFWGEVRHRTHIVQHQAVLFLNRHADPMVLFIRLGLFLAKMASLTNPCWPYMINVGIGGTLVAVAGLDLCIAGSSVTISQRSGGFRGAPARLEPPAGRRDWDLRASFILFVLHFLVLWVASRWGTLCPSSQEAWADWHPDI